MREISTEDIKVGEHVKIDGVEYVVEGYADCSECAFYNSKKCGSLPCCIGGSFSFKKVEKEPHRRLIEAEDVKKLMYSGVSLDTEEDKAYVCSLIDEMTTIIEASNVEAR